MKRKICCVLVLLALAMGCKKDPNGPDLNKGLVSYFNFEDNAVDKQGYSKDGIGNATYMPGKLGKALIFNGSDQKMVFSPLTPQANPQVSIACWVKSDDITNGKYFITNSAFQLLTFGGNAIIFQAKTSNSSGAVFGICKYDQWVHVVGIYDGQIVKIYINGQLTSGPSISGNFDGFKEDVTIGYNNSIYWPGSVDELRIYNRALTEAEVTALYNLK